MTLSFKYTIYMLVAAICSPGVVYTQEVSLKEIYKLRVAKIKKSRQFYGKKFLIKKIGNHSRFLANSVADMSARLGCDSSLQKIARQAFGKRAKKKGKLIAFACKVKQRER